MIQAKIRSIRGRQFTHRIVIGLSGLFTFGAIVILFGIIGTILWKGMPAIGLDFLFNQTKPSSDPSGGIGNAIVGTLMIVGTAAVIAVPTGLLGGVWLSEYARQSKLGDMVRFAANVMMGVPSIVIGLFIYAVLVMTFGSASGIAGSIALSILMFPIVLRVTEDMLCMVPNALRESALAVGMPRWQVTLSILFRYARNGLMTGILLSIARVAGETAPLLFTAQSSQYWPGFREFFTAPTANITVTINEYFGNDPSPVMAERAWGAALVILVAILMTNMTIRFFFSKKTQS